MSTPGPRRLLEPGSPEWCEATVRLLRDRMGHVATQWEQANELLEELIKRRAWERIPAEQPYGTLNKMLQAEVGLDSAAIRKMIREAGLAAHGRPRKDDNIIFDEGQGGTAADYTYRRLRRDHPRLADKVDAGELSPNAAAQAAGFRPRAVSVRLDNAESAARTLRTHMEAPVLADLVRLLNEGDHQ